MSLSALIIYGFLYGLPIAALIWFIVSLVLCIKADKSIKESYRTKKIMLIISGIVAGVFVFSTVALHILGMLIMINM